MRHEKIQYEDSMDLYISSKSPLDQDTTQDTIDNYYKNLSIIIRDL